MTPKQFEDIITRSNSTGGETLEIHYRDGYVVSGFVQRVSHNYSPPYVNLCKSEVEKGESEDHEVIFSEIVKLVVKPYQKAPIVYQ